MSRKPKGQPPAASPEVASFQATATPTAVRALLAVKKALSSNPREVKRSNTFHRAWNATLAADMPGMFVAFIRINCALAEDFSVGLRYHPEVGSPCVLLRVNGDHGMHGNPDGTVLSGPHVHAPTPAELGLLVTPGLWPEGPRHATTWAPQTLTILAAWNELAGRGTIAATPDGLQRIARLSAASGQAELPFP